MYTLFENNFRNNVLGSLCTMFVIIYQINVRENRRGNQ